MHTCTADRSAATTQVARSFQELDWKIKIIRRATTTSVTKHVSNWSLQTSHDSDIWITSEGDELPGREISQSGAPRSYFVDTPTGPVRRNRQHLTTVRTPKQDPGSDSVTSNGTSSETEPPGMILTRSQTGTPINPPRETGQKGERW